MGKEDKEKRKRISQACDACNRRKTRCDGSSPSCSTCVKLKIPCTYDRVAYKKKELETIQINSWNGLETTTYHIPLANASSSSSTQANIPLESSVAMTFNTSSFDNTNANTFMSWNNNASAATTTSRATASNSTQTTNPHLYFNQDLLFNTLHPNSFISSPENVSLGSVKRNVNWKLIELFFEHVHPLIPVFVKESFYIIAPFESTLLLNTMYAMSAKYEEKNGNVDLDAGKAYFQSALNEVSDACAKPNLSVVYSLFLLCYYGAFHHNPMFSSFFLGNALQMCFKLKLNKEDEFDYQKYAYRNFTTNQNMEIVRRLWWYMMTSDTCETRYAGENARFSIHEEISGTCLPSEDSSIWYENTPSLDWIRPASQEAKKEISILCMPGTFFHPIPKPNCVIAQVYQVHKIDRRVIDFRNRYKQGKILEHDADFEMQQIENMLLLFYKQLDPQFQNYVQLKYEYLGLEVDHWYWGSLYILLLYYNVQLSLYTNRLSSLPSEQVDQDEINRNRIIQKLREPLGGTCQIVALFMEHNPKFMYVSPIINAFIFEASVTMIMGMNYCECEEDVQNNRVGVELLKNALTSHGTVFIKSLSYVSALEKILNIEKSQCHLIPTILKNFAIEMGHEA